MIEKLSLADTRPGSIIDKINEVIDVVNNIVKDAESSANMVDPEKATVCGDPRD